LPATGAHFKSSCENQAEPTAAAQVVPAGLEGVEVIALPCDAFKKKCPTCVV
jgi:hypothetical protein